MKQDVKKREGENERIQQTKRSGRKKKNKRALKQTRRCKRKAKRQLMRDGRRKRSSHGIFPLWNSGRESG